MRVYRQIRRSTFAGGARPGFALTRMHRPRGGPGQAPADRGGSGRKSLRSYSTTRYTVWGEMRRRHRPRPAGILVCRQAAPYNGRYRFTARTGVCRASVPANPNRHLWGQTIVESLTLLTICIVAFLVVFLCLTVLALVLRFVTLAFPARGADLDAALLAAVTSVAATVYPGATITRVEEKK